MAGAQTIDGKTASRPRPGGAPAKAPLQIVVLVLLSTLLVGLSVLVAVPFLHALTWGVALAIMGWPMHKLIEARISQRSLAATLSTLIVILLIVVPGVFVAYQIGRETAHITAKTDTPPEAMMSRESLERIPWVGSAVAWLERLNVDVEFEARKLLTAFLPESDGVAHGSIAATVQFLVAMFILFYVFRDRGVFLHCLRDYLPLTRAESERVFSSAADSVYANLYATVVTGLIDSVTGGLLFWVLGLPAPVLWGAVMFILSILPVVGAGLVWFPIAMYLALTGDWAPALAILTWGGITAVVVDYILYAKLAGDRMRMHPVPALLAFLGGLAVFGLSGMILGPAIVAVTAAVLDLWRERNQETGAPRVDAA